jgi:hypothetical protein
VKNRLNWLHTAAAATTTTTITDQNATTALLSQQQRRRSQPTADTAANPNAADRPLTLLQMPLQPIDRWRCQRRRRPTAHAAAADRLLTPLPVPMLPTNHSRRRSRPTADAANAAVDQQLTPPQPNNRWRRCQRQHCCQPTAHAAAANQPLTPLAPLIDHLRRHRRSWLTAEQTPPSP